ncbi:MAG: hypothetical protein NTZ25_00295 [Candidatus Peregrinibacteria bacterium]|nr:hypothetical protein [Candidatus Peregrinibacteria bacterium]
MKLIITDSIYEKEFKPLELIFPIDLMKLAAKKSMCGLGENIKNSSKIPSTILKKVYLTSSGGAGRAIFLLQIGGENSFLVILRLKNDKKVGENMTISNPKFKKVLEKNLDLIFEEIKQGRYREFEI